MANDNGIPNLDEADEEQLRNIEVALETLQRYVKARRRARRARLNGNVELAILIESTMDFEYRTLPEWARW
jgi:hypothetical protein